MAHAIMKEALAMASRRKHQQQRGSGPIDTSWEELGRGMLAASSHAVAISSFPHASARHAPACV